jgi:hypothetical protein
MLAALTSEEKAGSLFKTRKFYQHTETPTGGKNFADKFGCCHKITGCFPFRMGPDLFFFLLPHH